MLLLGLALGFAACGDGGGPDKSTPTTAAQPSPTAVPTLPPELLGPPFEGELLGIFIGPNLVDSPNAIPDTFLTPRDVCLPGTPSVVVPWEQAGEMNLDLNLPPEYVPLKGSLNTGAFACGGTVTGTTWSYDLMLADGGSAYVIIGRNVLRLADYNVTTGRVKTAVVAGREAVVIEPAFPHGRHVSGVFGETR